MQDATKYSRLSNLFLTLQLSTVPVKLLGLVLAKSRHSLQATLQLVGPKQQRHGQVLDRITGDLGPRVEHHNPLQLLYKVVHGLVVCAAVLDGHGTCERDLRTREDAVARLLPAVGAARRALIVGQGRRECVDAAHEMALLMVRDVALERTEEEVQRVRQAAKGIPGDPSVSGQEKRRRPTLYRAARTGCRRR